MASGKVVNFGAPVSQTPLNQSCHVFDPGTAYGETTPLTKSYEALPYHDRKSDKLENSWKLSLSVRDAFPVWFAKLLLRITRSLGVTQNFGLSAYHTLEKVYEFPSTNQSFASFAFCQGSKVGGASTFLNSWLRLKCDTMEDALGVKQAEEIAWQLLSPTVKNIHKFTWNLSRSLQSNREALCRSWASGCVWMRWIYFVFLPAEGKQNKTFHPIARSMEPTIIEHPPCTSLVAFGSCPSFKSNNFHIFCLIPDVLFSPSESWPQGKVRRPGRGRRRLPIPSRQQKNPMHLFLRQSLRCAKWQNRLLESFW